MTYIPNALYSLGL